MRVRKDDAATWQPDGQADTELRWEGTAHERTKQCPEHPAQVRGGQVFKEVANECLASRQDELGRGLTQQPIASSQPSKDEQ